MNDEDAKPVCGILRSAFWGLAAWAVIWLVVLGLVS